MAIKWNDISHDLQERHKVLVEVIERLKDLPDSEALAATDLFVEKAQRQLTYRARALASFGLGAVLVAAVLLVASSYYLFHLKASEILGGLELSGLLLALLLSKAASAGGLLVGAVWLLVSMARALLHEATVLFNRRHALRFGRLFIYLHKGGIQIDDLERAFKWNDEFTTAFKDIRPSDVSRGMLAKLMEAVPEAVRTLNNKQEKKDDKGKDGG